MASRARQRATIDVAGISAARRREILNERERRLSARSEAATAPRESVRVLVCSIGPNLYGLPLDEVARVKPVGRWGAAAAGHPALFGLVADEGRVHPAFDLPRLLGADAPAPQGGWLVVLATPHHAALRVADLPVVVDAERVEDADGDRARVLGGDHRDRLLVLLSPRELLASIHSTSHGAAAP